MKRRDATSARMEADYLARVRAALAGREASEIDEIVQSVKEHIEEELGAMSGAEVNSVQMSNVLERLGPPEAYSQSEDVETETSNRAEKTSAAGFTWDKKGVLIIAGLISFAIGLLGLMLAAWVGLALVVSGVVLVLWAFHPRLAMCIALGVIAIVAVGLVALELVRRQAMIDQRTRAQAVALPFAAGVQTYNADQVNAAPAQPDDSMHAPKK